MAEELPIPNEPSMASKPPKGSPFNDGGVLAGGHSRRLALISVVGYFLLYPIFICSILLEESPTFAIIICIIMCIYVYIYIIYIYIYTYHIILFYWATSKHIIRIIILQFRHLLFSPLRWSKEQREWARSSWLNMWWAALGKSMTQGFDLENGDLSQILWQFVAMENDDSLVDGMGYPISIYQQKLVKLDNASIFVPNALAFNAACPIQWGFDHC